MIAILHQKFLLMHKKGVHIPLSDDVLMSVKRVEKYIGVLSLRFCTICGTLNSQNGDDEDLNLVGCDGVSSGAQLGRVVVLTPLTRASYSPQLTRPTT
jgi:hypothetical protein